MSKTSDKWLARAGHVLLTGIVLSLLFFKDTELRRDLYHGNWWYMAAYLAMLFFSTLTYFIASFLDPGYVALRVADAEEGVVFNSENTTSGNHTVHITEDEPENASERSEMLGGVSARDLRLRRCGFCDILQPLRAKHCEDCKRCVRRYDHHCPWLGNCVGERNHKFFLTFLFAETLSVSWTVYITVNSFKSRTVVKAWFRDNWPLLLLVIFLAISLLVVGLLWICHSYMMLTAQTTWEFMSRPRISYLKNFPTDFNPFHQGYVQNIVSFLCYFRPQQWNELYHKN